MAKYIGKRILMFIPMVLLMSFLIFGGMELTPGDYVSNMISPDMAANMTPEQLDMLREAYGLNDPFLVRYVKWLGQIIQGNWGYSLSSGVPVRDIIMQRLPVTLELALSGLIISAILGSILGIISALKRGTLLDHTLTVAGVIGMSIPQFFFGMVAILLFALNKPLFPGGGAYHARYGSLVGASPLSGSAGPGVGSDPDSLCYALFPGQHDGQYAQGFCKGSQK